MEISPTCSYHWQHSVAWENIPSHPISSHHLLYNIILSYPISSHIIPSHHLLYGLIYYHLISSYLISSYLILHVSCFTAHNISATLQTSSLLHLPSIGNDTALPETRNVGLIWILYLILGIIFVALIASSFVEHVLKVRSKRETTRAAHVVTSVDSASVVIDDEAARGMRETRRMTMRYTKTNVNAVLAQMWREKLGFDEMSGYETDTESFDGDEEETRGGNELKVPAAWSEPPVQNQYKSKQRTARNQKRKVDKKLRNFSSADDEISSDNTTKITTISEERTPHTMKHYTRSKPKPRKSRTKAKTKPLDEEYARWIRYPFEPTEPSSEASISNLLAEDWPPMGGKQG